MNNFVYAEVWIGGSKDRNVVREVVDMPDAYGKRVVDAYTSIYRFEKHFVDFVTTTGSVREYKGPCRSTGLHFDFDSTFNDLSLVECRKFIEELCSNESNNVYIDDIKIFFSGNKGFHLIVQTEEIKSIQPSEDVSDKIKKICMSLALKYSSFDRVVYDKTRLFRVINSINRKSGLYKIPLFASELFTMSLSDIKNMAKKQRRLSDKETIKVFLDRGLNGFA